MDKEYRSRAIRELKSYPLLRRSLDSLAMRICILEETTDFMTSSDPSRERIQGGRTGGAEERLLRNIEEREQLQAALERSRRTVELIEKGLESLSAEEREVVEASFFASSGQDELCGRRCFEKARFYRLRDRALRKYIAAQYGALH